MTLDDLWSLCVGEIGMSPESYLASSWREIVCTIHGYRRRIRNQDRVSWTQARMICYFAVSPHVKSGSIRNPEALFKLDGDKEYQAKDIGVSDNDLRTLAIPSDAMISHKSKLTKEEWDAKVKFLLARRKIEKEGKIKKQKLQNAKPR